MKRFTVSALFAFVAAATALSCQSRLFVEESQVQSGTQRVVIPIESVSKTDILFLVDNSGSMAQEQANLAANFAVFIGEILKGQNDFHIGVITTDFTMAPFESCPLGTCANPAVQCLTAGPGGLAVRPGDRVCMQECSTVDDCQPFYCESDGVCTPPFCGRLPGFDAQKKYCYPAVNGRLHACRGGGCGEFKGTHETVMTNKLRAGLGDEDFQRMFRDNVKVGTRGSATSGFEQGLNTLRMALDPGYIDPITGRNLVDHENRGFFRPKARLTLIAVSDEEDCSFSPGDPNFDLTRTADQCYPDPNSCHPDCLPGGTCDFNAPLPNPESRYGNLIPDDEFVKFFQGLKRSPDDVNMAVIIGAAPSGANKGEPLNCASVDGVACAGKRYFEVASKMSKFYADSICQVSFEETLVKIADVLVISNERVLGGEPLDPACIRVKVGGVDIPHCTTLESCGSAATDAGTPAVTCPEAFVLCANNDACTDRDGRDCDCAAISDPGRGCHCGPDAQRQCARPIYWQYKPPSCPGDGLPRVVFNGCGLETGDKLELSYLSASTTTGDAGLTCP